ncbi:MAG: hypothetical protein IKQ99_01190 [Alphaproteobacteria bacterium]|nr:hypothetical protein [Alphaproteobacteria bacterium]
MKNLLALKKMFWMSAPFLMGLFLILFSLVPINLLPYYHQSFPFVVTLIFYFSIFNPKVLNVFLVFLLGIINDMMTSLPLGFYAFGFVLIFFSISMLRSYLIDMVFTQLWIMFCLIFFCTDVIWAFLFFLISGIWVSTGFWFVQYLFVCLFFPFFCRFSGYLNHKIQEVQ